MASAGRSSRSRAAPSATNASASSARAPTHRASASASSQSARSGSFEPRIMSVERRACQHASAGRRGGQGPRQLDGELARFHGLGHVAEAEERERESHLEQRAAARRACAPRERDRVAEPARRRLEQAGRGGGLGARGQQLGGSASAPGPCVGARRSGRSRSRSARAPRGRRTTPRPPARPRSRRAGHARRRPRRASGGLAGSGSRRGHRAARPARGAAGASSPGRSRSATASCSRSCRMA